jgi:beta-galactosidase/beta-glucuronidase
VIAERSCPEKELKDKYGHPRPQFRRDDWVCLNGDWDFAIDAEAEWRLPSQVDWRQTIQVPYSPETPASGVGENGLYKSVWYRRRFAAPPVERGDRLFLHFGAVDTTATVWVNGHIAGRHHGGYTPFHIDITDHLLAQGDQTVVVRAEDNPLDLTKPRGKQDWQLKPHSIWYPRTTGIWQTVWLECVPQTWIDYTRWVPVLERWEIAMEARICGEMPDDTRLRVRLESAGQVLSDDLYSVQNGEVYRGIRLSDPGIDDFRNELLWRPSRPNLIDATLELLGPDGRVIDRLHSYTALRSIGVQGDRFILNGRPLYLCMVLDQGYWPETGATPPDDDAARRDVELALAMGFNGVRYHQKVADPRYLYWADRLGLLVWSEMPSACRFTKRSVKQLYREWTEVIERDVSHPCIVAWVPLNESWGVPDLPDSPAQRHYVKALYHLTKTLDPCRPVIGNDGWESVATDIIAIHDYEPQPETLVSRYGAEDRSFTKLAQRERPAGRLLALDEMGSESSHPIMLTEFGGIGLSDDFNGTWGYSRVHSSDELAVRYKELMTAVRSLPIFSGFCYTQFADTYQEANGLLYADRTPKFPIELVAAATAGPDRQRDRRYEALWRERLMADRMNAPDSPQEHKIS